MILSLYRDTLERGMPTKRRVTNKNDVLLRINDWFFLDDRIISVIMICTVIDWLNV